MLFRSLFDTIIVEESDLTPELRADLAPIVEAVIGAPIVMHDDAARLDLALRVVRAGGGEA